MQIILGNSWSMVVSIAYCIGKQKVGVTNGQCYIPLSYKRTLFYKRILPYRSDLEAHALNNPSLRYYTCTLYMHMYMYVWWSLTKSPNLLCSSPTAKSNSYQYIRLYGNVLPHSLLLLMVVTSYWISSSKCVLECVQNNYIMPTYTHFRITLRMGKTPSGKL